MDTVGYLNYKPTLDSSEEIVVVGAKTSEKRWINHAGNILSGCIPGGCKLGGCTLGGYTLGGSILSGSTLSESTQSGSTLNVSVQSSSRHLAEIIGTVIKKVCNNGIFRKITFGLYRTRIG